MAKTRLALSVHLSDEDMKELRRYIKSEVRARSQHCGCMYCCAKTEPALRGKAHVNCRS